VYQENVYYKQDKPFVSFRKVLRSMGPEFNDVELVSFHSTSKGVLGECGMRGGYMELTNIDDDGYEQIYKLQSIDICPTTTGQIVVDLMCNPPQKGDESYELYSKEYKTQYESLRKRAVIINEELNKIEGIKCQRVSGAMYAFPKIDIPPKAIAVAKEHNMAPDAFYCWQLLETKGICVVPGSGFHQKDNTFHFRTTILPPEDQLVYCVHHIGDFHNKFTAKYS